MDVRLPLYRLFARLREAGLNLGMEEYLLALKLAGLTIQDKEHLRRLLRHLWVTSRDESLTFDTHYNRFFTDYYWPEKPRVGEEEDQVTQKGPSEPYDPGQDDITQAFSGEGGGEPAPEASSPETSPAAASIRRKELFPPAQAPQRQFVLTPTFSPVSGRELGQNWKYLRAWKEGRPGRELDIPAVVREVSRRGFFIRPHYLPEKVNAIQLILMVDRGGSMVPFHPLSDQISRSALHLGKLRKENLLYFHDQPSGPLYRNPRLLHEVEGKEWMAELSPRATAVMIFSDGGAARGSFSDERVYDTFRFFDKLSPRIHRLAWLNPVPEERWRQSSAGFIKEFCPMFEANRQGMKAAIDYLLGKSGKGLL